ncbi:hypothetical protein Plhal710r2_c011g0049981 [Plasmopara halstedii]
MVFLHPVVRFDPRSTDMDRVYVAKTHGTCLPPLNSVLSSHLTRALCDLSTVPILFAQS